jgi:hypothetical protein
VHKWKREVEKQSRKETRNKTERMCRKNERKHWRFKK